MSVINRMIKKKNKILQQLSKRLEEMSEANETHSVLGFQGPRRPFNSDLFPGCTNSYKAFKFDTFTLKSNLADSCCMLNSLDPIQIVRFCRDETGSEVVIAKQFQNARDVFAEPVPSSTLGIYMVDCVSDEEHVFPISDIAFKFVKLPYHEFFILIPILHNL